MVCKGRCFTALGAQHFLQGECGEHCHLEPCLNSPVCGMWQPAHMLEAGVGLCGICQLIFGARLEQVFASPGDRGVQCGICLDEAGPDTPIFLLPNCQHGTCAECMQRWLPSVVLDRTAQIPPRVLPAEALGTMDPLQVQALFDTIDRHTEAVCTFLAYDRNLFPTCHTCRRPCARLPPPSSS